MGCDICVVICEFGLQCDRKNGESSELRQPAISFVDAARQVAEKAGLPAVSQLSHHQTRANLMENLVQEVASPRTYALLKEYYEQSKARTPEFATPRHTDLMLVPLKTSLAGSAGSRGRCSGLPMAVFIVLCTQACGKGNRELVQSVLD